uniref:Uncharacterized protein n=1 Tax=Anguilla anguilla TaxID=7936 RepID=A0A0E9XEA2_ANGAN
MIRRVIICPHNLIESMEGYVYAYTRLVIPQVRLLISWMVDSTFSKLKLKLCCVLILNSSGIARY